MLDRPLGAPPQSMGSGQGLATGVWGHYLALQWYRLGGVPVLFFFEDLLKEIKKCMGERGLLLS